MAAEIFSGTSAFPLTTTASGPSRLEQEVVALFDRFRAPLLRYLFSLRIPAPDAEEIVQEVFLALFRHLQQGKSRTNLPGWVFKVAHNLALKERTRARREFERSNPGAEVADLPARAADCPERRLQSIEQQERLLAAVRGLPEQDRCCLGLRAEGLRYREIAGVLGISLGSVSNSLARSLASLAEISE